MGKEETEMQVPIYKSNIRLGLRLIVGILNNDFLYWGTLAVIILQLVGSIIYSNDSDYNIERDLKKEATFKVPINLNYTSDFGTFQILQDQLTNSQNDLLNTLNSLIETSSIVSQSILKDLNITMDSIKVSIYNNLKEQNSNLNDLENLIESNAAFISGDVDSKMAEAIPLNYTWIPSYLNNEVTNALEGWSSIKMLNQWINLNNSKINDEVREIFQNTSIKLQDSFQDNGESFNTNVSFNGKISYNDYKYFYQEKNKRIAQKSNYVSNLKKLKIWNLVLPISGLIIGLAFEWITNSYESEIYEDFGKHLQLDQMTTYLSLGVCAIDPMILRMVNFIRYRKSLKIIHKEMRSCYTFLSILFGKKSNFNQLLKGWVIILVLFISVKNLYTNEAENKLNTVRTQKSSDILTSQTFQQTFTLHDFSESYSFNNKLNLSTIISIANSRLYNDISKLIQDHNLGNLITFNNSEILSLPEENNSTISALISTSYFTVEQELPLFNSSGTTIVKDKVRSWAETYLMGVLIGLSAEMILAVIVISCLTAFGTTNLVLDERWGNRDRIYTAAPP